MRAQIAERAGSALGPFGGIPPRAPERLAGVDLVEHRLGHPPAERASRRAVLGPVDLGRLDVDPDEIAGRLPEGGVHREDLLVADAGHRASLGRLATDGGQDHVQLEMAAGRRKGEVLGGCPDRGPAGRVLHRDDAGGQPTPPVHEFGGRGESRLDIHLPVELFVIERAHSEEFAGVHRRAP
jgi:hypothetical protein